jgi:anaerobic selenocysteine-containing dehydrogenase
MSNHHQADQTPTPRYKPYKGAAGGWGALISVAQAWLTSDNALKNLRMMLKTNQNGGFDCPGCAWGDSPGKRHGQVLRKRCQGSQLGSHQTPRRCRVLRQAQRHRVAGAK